MACFTVFHVRRVDMPLQPVQRQPQLAVQPVRCAQPHVRDARNRPLLHVDHDAGLGTHRLRLRVGRHAPQLNSPPQPVSRSTCTGLAFIFRPVRQGLNAFTVPCVAAASSRSSCCLMTTRCCAWRRRRRTPSSSSSAAAGPTCVTSTSTQRWSPRRSWLQRWVSRQRCLCQRSVWCRRQRCVVSGVCCPLVSGVCQLTTVCVGTRQCGIRRQQGVGDVCQWCMSAQLSSVPILSRPAQPRCLRSLNSAAPLIQRLSPVLFALCPQPHPSSSASAPSSLLCPQLRPSSSASAPSSSLSVLSCAPHPAPQPRRLRSLSSAAPLIQRLSPAVFALCPQLRPSSSASARSSSPSSCAPASASSCSPSWRRCACCGTVAAPSADRRRAWRRKRRASSRSTAVGSTTSSTSSRSPALAPVSHAVALVWRRPRSATPSCGHARYHNY